MFAEFGNDYALQLYNHGGWVNACDFEDCYGGFIYLKFDRNWITNCHFARNSGTNPAIYIYYDKQWIINCNFQDLKSKAIDIASNVDNVWIMNCYFANWGTCTTEAAIRLGNNLTEIHINNNTFDGCGGTKGDYAINSCSNIITGLMITGNRFKNCVSTPVVMPVSANMVDCVIEDNSGDEDTKSTTSDCQTWGLTKLAGTTACQTITLPDGFRIGQVKKFVMTNATNTMTLSVSHHVISDPKTFTFDDIDDYLELVWNGTSWITTTSYGV